MIPVMELILVAFGFLAIGIAIYKSLTYTP